VDAWLKKSFLKVDDELRTEAGQNKLGDLRRAKPPKKPAILNILGEQDKDKKDLSEQTNEEMMLDSIGCTANVVVVDKKKGKLYVANAGDSRCVMGKAGKAVEMSVDHKPENPTEIERIEKSGSTITEGRVDGNLNLTRSLGDLKHKNRSHLKPEEQAITANPDTYEFALEDDVDFILMGCDGIWEKKSNEEAVEWVYAKIEE
jgi:serine/threonine protein phosphatase PrpC